MISTRPPDGVDSVSIAFLVSAGIFIAASGWLGDRFGGRKVLLGSRSSSSPIASALCGLAQNLDRARLVPGPAGRRAGADDTGREWRCCFGYSRPPSASGRRASS